MKKLELILEEVIDGWNDFSKNLDLKNSELNLDVLVKSYAYYLENTGGSRYYNFKNAKEAFDYFLLEDPDFYSLSEKRFFLESAIDYKTFIECSDLIGIKFKEDPLPEVEKLISDIKKVM